MNDDLAYFQSYLLCKDGFRHTLHHIDVAQKVHLDNFRLDGK